MDHPYNQDSLSHSLGPEFQPMKIPHKGIQRDVELIVTAIS